ncbi:MAG TPA: metal ABC transporter substrate-binding protein [Verrucomicrobiae bacterium]|nr:metal ABC transporter substrate-binding protein [Verrucomicrobiae bacterium]
MKTLFGWLKNPVQGEVRVACMLICLLGLSVFASTAHAKLNVVATTPDIASIAKEIGGDKIELTTLARPTEDPHFVDAKPSFIVKLNKADVLIHGGAELESGWLPKLIEQARNAKIVSAAKGEVRCCEGVKMLEVPQKLDRSAGDIHASGNPHFLVDPENAKIVAHHIADTFASLDSAHREFYEANSKRFMTTLDSKLAEWQAKLAPFKGEHIVAYHNSWIYFAERFGLKIDLFLEPKPGIPPSPAHLASIIARMKEENARVIIVDPYLNRKTAETVARSTGAIVVNVAQFPGGVKGTEGGYIALMDYLVNSLATALGKK